MVRPNNETEHLVLSNTKNCEMVIREFHKKAQEALEFNLTKPKEIFLSIHQPQLKDAGG